MANAALMGWDAAAKVWRKLVCNAAGKLIIDPSEIFEEVPTDNEAGKAPTSNWAFDHKANASAHHARYTDVESRAAINNLFNATGILSKDMNCNYKTLTYLQNFMLRFSLASTAYVNFRSTLNGPGLIIEGMLSAGGYTPSWIKIYNGSVFEFVATEPVVDSKILTHKNIANAHHARYTDAEAVAAVGYNGTKYWSCAGIHFDAINPAASALTKSDTGSLRLDADNINLVAHVSLPHGAVVTSVIINGNAAASAENWVLYRSKISDVTWVVMAAALFNTADSTIVSGTIDNSLYSYYLYTSSLDTNDEIWGAIITYTI